MTIDPDDDLRAAEFVLGTLEPGERATLAARRQRETQLQSAISAWEGRLAPLAEATPPIELSRDLLPEIEARIHGRRRAPRAVAPQTMEAPENATTPLVMQMRRWRAAALAASSLAALLIVGFISREVTRENAPHEFVAVLQKSADAPAFAISVNVETRQFTVRPVSASAPEGKSYELWLIAPEFGSPRSLGVIDAAQVTHVKPRQSFARASVIDATYAVTVEPSGGSPDGKPSGPPVFVGKLIPVDP